MSQLVKRFASRRVWGFERLLVDMDSDFVLAVHFVPPSLLVYARRFRINAHSTKYRDPFINVKP